MGVDSLPSMDEDVGARLGDIWKKEGNGVWRTYVRGMNNETG